MRIQDCCRQYWKTFQHIDQRLKRPPSYHIFQEEEGRILNYFQTHRQKLKLLAFQAKLHSRRRNL